MTAGISRVRRLVSRPATSRPRPAAHDREGYASLFAGDRSAPHWAVDYARRLAERHPASHVIVIQTSMSPTGPFHVGNFRDTACAHLVHRALLRMGRRSQILLSFDDYDPVRPGSVPGQDGRCLGALGERSRRLCRQYLAELTRAGICPPDLDADGRGAHEQWQTHYQHERYLAGEYATLQRTYQRDAARLTALLNGSRPERLFAVYCEACGRNTTTIEVLGSERVGYRCRSCGTARATTDPGPVKPIWAVDWTLRVAHEGIDCEPAGQDHCTAGSTMDRTRPVFSDYLHRPQPVIIPYGLVREPGQHRKISGSTGGGLRLGDLLDVMPARMVLWLYGRAPARSDIRIGLDWATMHAAYAAFDAFVDAAAHGGRAAALHELVTDDPPHARLPRWRSVLGALHASSYDPAAACEHLVPGDSPLRALVAERVEHARAWLARHGRDRCWIVRDVAADRPAGPEIPTAAGVPPEPPEPSGHRPPGASPELFPGGPAELAPQVSPEQIYRALFGTRCGPPLRRVREQFGAAQVATALAAASEGAGDRPHEPGVWRSVVLARLAVPQAQVPDAG